MSLGGDEDRPLAESRVNQLAERAVASCLVLVAAAGNSGCGERHRCLPPATAPSVIAVGGYDDRNDPERRQIGLYCSSFGRTADGLVKPELIAPAMWVAAPILPGTPAYLRAEVLARLAATPDNRLAAALAAARDRLGASLPPEMAGVDAVRRWIDEALRAERIVSAHYQQVDGTSFSAPLAASVAARMIEANPRLSPQDVKRILLQTARPVGELPALRQGYGVLDPRGAVAAARIEAHSDRPDAGPSRLAPGRIEFRFHDDTAKTVAVAGSFDGWRSGGRPMRREGLGKWRLSLPAPPPGTYRYKFVVDGTRWLSDPTHARREPDPYGGFDSILEVL
jgi:serine protease AprX